MCTVSFIPRKQGYLIAMNRDEQRSRVEGLPPKQIRIGERQVICPSEPGGGTWIALNDIGVTFALINWYSVKEVVAVGPVSRGGVIRAVAGQVASSGVSLILQQLPLPRINPFRLIGIFPAQREVFEWRWDLKQLTQSKHPWIAGQWISSGHDELAAQRIRSETFQAALRQKTAPSADWLRRLHRSHGPVAGPFSICMHRADAATVSYTEVIVSAREGRMKYCAQAPCGCGANWHRNRMRIESVEFESPLATAITQTIGRERHNLTICPL